jgi:hypothetical protein
MGATTRDKAKGYIRVEPRRFPGPNDDRRFPGPNDDRRFPGPNDDRRFPGPNDDRRFPGPNDDRLRQRLNEAQCGQGEIDWRGVWSQRINFLDGKTVDPAV